jgi:hypothetical protein
MSNASGSDSVKVTLSERSIRLLDTLAGRGIYGRNKSEVAGRFVDAALQRLVETNQLKLDNNAQKKRADK